MRSSLPLLFSLALSTCGGTDERPDASGPDLATFAPDPRFERFCRKPWERTLEAAKVGELSGQYQGVITGLSATRPFTEGVLETMKVVPTHPFRLDHIRVAFGKGEGKARIRLMTTLGRSYPGAWDDMTDTSKDLLPPITVDVANADPEKWIDLDVSAANVLLEPTQHYMIVYEHLDQGPFLAMEDLPAGQPSRALLFVPWSQEAYGLDGNYRLELEGRQFCAWTDEDRWFLEQGNPAFFSVASARAAVSDIDGDGHDDLIVIDGNPIAFLGDGKGGFALPSFDPFPDGKAASMLVFADVDNDGDEDAFAARYVSVDGDGDKFAATEAPYDCDDTDAKVYPGAIEVMGNGKDDNCDGVTDDGKSVADKDKDGVTVAKGDCDDNRADVHPGAPEILDGRDNDCDGRPDEDFASVILLNDGKGHFSLLKASGVEGLAPTTAAAFGDGNGDGKLDLYYGNWLRHYPDDPAVQDRYFEGAGGGKFVDAQKRAGLVLPKPFSCYGVTWCDYNNDGLQDLYVSNYHMYPNQLWKNLGGKFVNVGVEVGVAYDDIEGPLANLIGGHSYGVTWGDFDNDGDMDAYITNLAHPRVQPWGNPSMFAVNQGPPDYGFANEREQRGFVYDEGDVNAAFADFDNDGDLDIAIASLYTGHYSRLYRNDGGKFTDVTYETSTAVHDAVSVVWSDVDEDGDLDLFIADRDGLPMVHLFMNKVGQDNAWVELLLEGTKSNRDAIGARVNLRSGGVSQMRDVHGGEGHSNTQQTRIVHFGLGKATAIDEVTVRWVGGGSEVFTGVKPRGRYRIVEGSGTATPL